MCSLMRSALLAAVGIVVASAAGAISQERQAKPNGSISGYVSIGDAPARGVTVLLQAIEQGPMQRPAARATTDHEGRFQMIGVAAGQYYLQTFALALVVPNDQMFGRQGKLINLTDGEAVEGVDLVLGVGGVITGRVTDTNGQPIVQENVRLLSVNEQGQHSPSAMYLANSFMFSTDDRGVYRLFGLPPGRYIVGVGAAPTSPAGLANTYRQLTFHPEAIDESKATVIELASGSEATGVDIVVSGEAKVYSASGRIVDAATGKPIAGLPFAYGATDPGSGQLRMRSASSSTSNARGEFRLDGITPGQYVAFASPPNDSELCSDTAPFTIVDSNVSGLIIKVHIGSSITGNVIIEGAEGQTGVPRFSEFRLSVSASSLNVAPRFVAASIAPDGSFRVSGLPRGMANFSLTYPPPKGLSLSRIERDEVVQKGSIEVGATEEISGIKVVFLYGTGAIRGQVTFEGGDVPRGTMMFLTLQRIGGDQNPYSRSTQVDLRGRFFIDGLPPGNYDLRLMVQFRASRPDANGPPIVSKNVKKTITVTNGMETPVTMQVNLNENDR